MGKKGTRSLLLRCSSSKSTRRPPKSPIHSRESRKRGGADSSRPEPADPQRGRASLTCSDENPPSARRRNQHRSGLSDEARELVWLLWSKPDRCWSMEERAAASSPRQETRNSPKQVTGESSPGCSLALTFPTLCGFDSQARDPVEVTIRSHDEMTTTNVVRRSVQGLHGLLNRPCPSSNCFRQFKRGGRGSDAGRGSRRRDLHPKGDVCAGHKLASDIRWLYLLLAACAPVHAPLTRGHRLPPGTSGPSGSPGGARP